MVEMGKSPVLDTGRLSPRYVSNNAITSWLSRIERTKDFFDTTEVSADWIAGTTSAALVRETFHTMHLVYPEITLDQVERVLAGEVVPEMAWETSQLTLNYRDTFTWMAQYFEPGRRITEAVIREMHGRLAMGTDSDARTAGEYRGEETGPIAVAPAAGDVPRLMADLAALLNDSSNTPSILLSGIAQFDVLYIQPFAHLNGPVARLLSLALLHRGGYGLNGVYTLSHYYDADPAAYHEAFDASVRQEIDLTGWLEYFVEGLFSEMRDAQEAATEANRRQLILFKARAAGLRPRALKALAFLLEKGGATPRDMELALAENRSTLQRALKVLIDRGLVREVRTPDANKRRYEPVAVDA